MSQVKANSYYDTSGGSNAVLYGVAAPPNSMGFRNRIINGDMRIDQRNAGASVTPSGGSYTLDRWSGQTSQTGKFSVQRNAGSVTPPAGFTNYLGVTSLSAYSVTATDYFNVAQNIEGLNVGDLGWGTANAQPVTISFWVRSSLTGTFGGALNNSGASRSYPFTYPINAANTWEYKTLTIAGDTTGTWLTDTGIGITVTFGLGAGATRSGTAGSWASSWFQSATGAVSVVGTSGATFYITGVQLEAGTFSVAPPFERRPYGQELVLCQRYYQTSGGEVVGATSGTAVAMLTNGSDTGNCRGAVRFPVCMRATPTVTLFNNETGASGGVVQNGVGYLTNCVAGAVSVGGFGAYQNNNNNYQTSVRFITAFYFASAEL